MENDNINAKVDKQLGKVETLHLNFVDTITFQKYLQSNEYNDPAFQIGGCLFSLVSNQLYKTDHQSSDRKTR